MSLQSQVLADFGKSIGIDDFDFNDQGVATLEFEDDGTLYVESIDGHVLIYLAREFLDSDHQVLESALEHCHWEHNLGFPVNAGVTPEQRLVFSVRIVETQLTLPVFEQVFRLLNRLQEESRVAA